MTDAQQSNSPTCRLLQIPIELIVVTSDFLQTNALSHTCKTFWDSLRLRYARNDLLSEPIPWEKFPVDCASHVQVLHVTLGDSWPSSIGFNHVTELHLKCAELRPLQSTNVIQTFHDCVTGPSKWCLTKVSLKPVTSNISPFWPLFGTPKNETITTFEYCAYSPTEDCAVMEALAHMPNLTNCELMTPTTDACLTVLATTLTESCLHLEDFLLTAMHGNTRLSLLGLHKLFSSLKGLRRLAFESFGFDDVKRKGNESEDGNQVVVPTLLDVVLLPAKLNPKLRRLDFTFPGRLRTYFPSEIQPLLTSLHNNCPNLVFLELSVKLASRKGETDELVIPPLRKVEYLGLVVGGKGNAQFSWTVFSLLGSLGSEGFPALKKLKLDMSVELQMAPLDTKQATGNNTLECLTLKMARQDSSMFILHCMKFFSNLKTLALDLYKVPTTQGLQTICCEHCIDSLQLTVRDAFDEPDLLRVVTALTFSDEHNGRSTVTRFSLKLGDCCVPLEQMEVLFSEEAGLQHLVLSLCSSQTPTVHRGQLVQLLTGVTTKLHTATLSVPFVCRVALEEASAGFERRNPSTCFKLSGRSSAS